jgi:amino acid adenylation domain-containing protein
MRPSSFPASFAQQRLWFLDHLEPDTAAYNLPRAFRIVGPLEIEIFRRALQSVVQRHASLRTVFDSVNGECRQVILPDGEVSFSLIDLAGMPEAERKAKALLLVGEEGRKPFDLSEGPLLRCLLVRLGEREHVLLFVMHHIITDGWSISILFKEVTTCYAAFVRNETPALPELPIQYSDYAQWQRECVQGEVLTQQIGYWKERLASAQSVLELPTDHPRPQVAGWRGATEEICLDSGTLAKLKSLAQAENSTLFMVSMAVFQALLWRYTGQERILVGTPVAARKELEFENMIGLFVNTLVFRSDFETGLTFRELIRQVRASTLDAFTHQDVPFEKLVEVLVPQRSLDTHPLFQVMFTFQNIPKQVFEIPGLSIKEMAFEAGIAKFDLSAEVWEDDRFHCQFEYRTDLFDPSTVRRMLGHFENLLQSALQKPDLRLAELPMMSAEERTQVLVEWNRTAADFPQDLTIPKAFEDQVERTPDATALLCEGERWTYRQLDKKANQLAHLLAKRKIATGSRVAIFLNRSAEMVIALLGILKAGAAYVPLDPAYPVERVRLMLGDAQVSGVVTVSALKDGLPENVREVIALDRFDQEQFDQVKFDQDEFDRGVGENHFPAEFAAASTAASSDIAYVIYTSGSTGTPKGVQGRHRGSMNRFAWMWRKYPFQPGDVCCQKTSLTFVDSIWEIFGPLLAGVPSVILSRETVLDPELLLQTLAREHVTRIILVPSQLRALLEHAPNLGERVPELTMWSCSGELLPVDVARRFRAAFPAAMLLNIYGSSEVAADATYHEIGEEDFASVVPIGQPISNTQVYLVDEGMNLSPVGVRGEIYIGGAGVAHGYWNRPELTAERFVPNRLEPERGGRLYRTGDLGRWRSNGEIEYLGRVDTQIKLRGQRIELGEIESVLASHVAVREAVVAVRGEGEQQKLAAYLVLQEAVAAPSAGELRRYLRAKLPEAMVPAGYWQIEKVPLLASGKVNRGGLSGGKALVDQEEWVGARTETEAQLAAIWRELLKVEKVGVEQNFFELGGHSLLVLQMTARMRRVLEVEMPVRSVFDAPTIAALAREVEKVRSLGLKAHTPILRRRQPSTAEMSREELLAKLDHLSGAELESVLRRVLERKEPATGGLASAAD